MTNYRNPVLANAAGDRITCEIEHPTFGWIPFTAAGDDPEPTGRALFALIAAEGTAAPFVPAEPAPILPNISARQLRLMLLSIGITPAMVDTELAAIADETERATAQIEWQYASTYERSHPLIDQMAAAFELPAAQVDTLWAAAADL